MTKQKGGKNGRQFNCVRRGNNGRANHYERRNSVLLLGLQQEEVTVGGVPTV
ncbi:MAG: hypothetical protein NUV61_02330 [Candidatus Azambacteria bacterium]|nr:hypothetical protein [Candidatus Azambacteria bacterium]